MMVSSILGTLWRLVDTLPLGIGCALAAQRQHSSSRSMHVLQARSVTLLLKRRINIMIPPVFPVAYFILVLSWLSGSLYFLCTVSCAVTTGQAP